MLNQPKRYGLYFDTERCVQCHACEIACKSLHGIEPGVKWRMVFNAWTGRFPNVTSRSLAHGCLHCAEPACEAACPTGAIRKRDKDGIVVVDKSKCIGCRSCQMVCPFGIPQFGRDGLMQKCDLCVDRRDEGKEPACAATCPSQALCFGSIEELNAIVAQKGARKVLKAAVSLHGTAEI